MQRAITYSLILSLGFALPMLLLAGSASLASASGTSQAAGCTPGHAGIKPPESFNAMDKNHDYYVDKKEAEAAMPNLNFAAADTDHDGHLSRVEFLDLKQKIKAGTWTNCASGEGKVNPESIKGSKENPVKVVKQAAKGTLKDPYDPTNKKVAQAGHELFQNHGCSGCHGGDGGGGMCPPLSNDAWVYGDSDDTLFRLITLGSAQLQQHGYTRTGMESVVGLMPQQGGVNIKTAGDLWKIITWIKSLHEKPGNDSY